ncbi:hypothetical protein [Microcoleus sp. OTE_8_concoct_300]|uniref:hypothetical protein n=1 Tax=Microcoleus sp. OTE_8_concoct_300 TaxID=2964710 RepID=UPI00403F0A77
MQALLLPRKQQKRDGILCRNRDAGKCCPWGWRQRWRYHTYSALQRFLTLSLASYLGHRNFSFFDCIAGSKNKSFLLILTIATNLTFGLLLVGSAVREGESAKEKAIAHRELPSPRE